MQPFLSLEFLNNEKRMTHLILYKFHKFTKGQTAWSLTSFGLFHRNKIDY